MKWHVVLRDGSTGVVEADELLAEPGPLRFCNNIVEGAALAERFVDVLVLAPGIWASVSAADAAVTWTGPPSAQPRIPERF